MTTAPSARPGGTSHESDALRELYADWTEIMAGTPELTPRLLRSVFDERHQVTGEPTEVTDALVTVPLLEGMIAGVLAEGAVDPATPLANPLHADLTGFPRLYVNAGSAETLLDNTTRLADRAEAAGVDVTLSVVDGMQHVFPFLAGRAAEADQEIQATAAWYRS